MDEVTIRERADSRKEVGICLVDYLVVIVLVVAAHEDIPLVANHLTVPIFCEYKSIFV